MILLTVGNDSVQKAPVKPLSPLHTLENVVRSCSYPAFEGNQGNQRNQTTHLSRVFLQGILPRQTHQIHHVLSMPLAMPICLLFSLRFLLPSVCMSTRNVRKWAEGRPILLSAISVQIACWADDAYRFMMALRYNPKFRSVFPVHDARKWLSYYRKHRIVVMTVVRDYWGLFWGNRTSSLMAKSVRSYALNGEKPVLALPQEKVVEEIERFGHDFSAQIWDSIEEMLSETPRTDEDRLAEWRRLSSQEAVFCFRIWFPCWLEYGLSAQHLLRQARQGDIHAIDRILRLDELTLQDPRIILQFSQARQNPAGGRFKRMYSALGGIPDRKLSSKNVKENIGAAISIASELWGSRISGPDIRRLYDAIAQDRERKPIDMDFTDEEPESFSRAMRRHRPFWQPLFRSWPFPTT